MLQLSVNKMPEFEKVARSVNVVDIKTRPPRMSDGHLCVIRFFLRSNVCLISLTLQWLSHVEPTRLNKMRWTGGFRHH